MNERLLLTARELADAIGVSPSTILDWWQAGKIPGFRFGRAVRFDLDEILQLGRQGPAAGGEAPTTPTARRPGRLLSQVPTTPNRGGQDAD